MSRALRLLALATLALFVALGAISKLWLEPAGLPIFDARFGGYDLPAAQAYLEGLSEGARAHYLGIYRVLDTLLPLTLGGFLMALAWRLGTGPGRAVLLLLALGYLAADLQENAQVALLLLAEGLDAAQVQRASFYTQAKWLSLGLSALLWGGIWGRQRWGGRTAA